MADWLKILISALAGVGTGTILEPVKGWVGRQLMARRARKAIYRDLAGLYQRMIILGHELGLDFAEMVLKEVKIETFDYFYEHFRESVYEIDEWQELQHLFDAVKKARSEIEVHGLEENVIMALEEEFDRYIGHKLIDVKLFQAEIKRLKDKKTADSIIE